MTDPIIGAVVLTYNSVGELSVCLEGLRCQKGVDLRVIVVDNASSDGALAILMAEFRSLCPEGVVGTIDEIDGIMDQQPVPVFIKNSRNLGYSAGNNIGAKWAAACGCQAVLIVNPDMQIRDPLYVRTLADKLECHPNCQVAGSRIVGLDGADQSGLREAGFWEELLWISQIWPRARRPKSFVTAPQDGRGRVVDKVHGCCQMIRTSFLQEIKFLDEKVFLYCEEPILAAQVHARGGRLMVFPEVNAIHAHVASKKGPSSSRMLGFIRSRLYYLKTYSGYGPLRCVSLYISYSTLYALHACRSVLQKAARSR